MRIERAPAAGLLLLLGACASGAERDPGLLTASFEEAAAPSGPGGPRPLVLGERAPDFALPDLEGGVGHLSDHTGEIVVLEWINPACPFVRYGHERGTLKELPGRLAERGVAWLAINSGAPGKHGTEIEENRAFAREHELGFPVLLDGEGEVGRAYGATHTPEVFVIDARGYLAYRGPVDNAPFGKVPGGAPLQVYAELAVDSLIEERPFEPPQAELYGCAVKYATNRAPSR